METPFGGQSHERNYHR
jgi:hypothetical protein